MLWKLLCWRQRLRVIPNRANHWRSIRCYLSIYCVFRNNFLLLSFHWLRAVNREKLAQVNPTNFLFEIAKFQVSKHNLTWLARSIIFLDSWINPCTFNLLVFWRRLEWDESILLRICCVFLKFNMGRHRQVSATHEPLTMLVAWLFNRNCLYVLGSCAHLRQCLWVEVCLRQLVLGALFVVWEHVLSASGINQSAWVLLETWFKLRWTTSEHRSFAWLPLRSTSERIRCFDLCTFLDGSFVTWNSAGWDFEIAPKAEGTWFGSLSWLVHRRFSCFLLTECACLVSSLKIITFLFPRSAIRCFVSLLHELSILSFVQLIGLQ